MTDQATNDPGRQVGGNHYGGTMWQHWDWVEHNRMGYLEGQLSRYVLRWRKKDGLKDLEKAMHFQDKIREEYTNRGRHNRRYSGWYPTGTGTRSEELYTNMGAGPTERAICEAAMAWKGPTDLLLIERLLCDLIDEAKGTKK